VSIGTVDRAFHGRPGITDSNAHSDSWIAQQYDQSRTSRSRASRRSQIDGPKNRRLLLRDPFFSRPAWAGVLIEGRRAAQWAFRIYQSSSHIAGRSDTERSPSCCPIGVDGIILTAGNPARIDSTD